MISPESLQASINGYSIPAADESAWAPYVMNTVPVKPHGDKLSIPEGGKASQQRFQEIATVAIRSLIDEGREPTAYAVRHAIIDGSLPVENGIDLNYRGGVDCSGFVYFALKGSGAAIDRAVMVPQSAVRHAAAWAKWDSERPELHELLEQAADNALSVDEFTRTFYPTPHPHKHVNTASLATSSKAIEFHDAQPGDILIYRRSPDAAPTHVALVKDVGQHGELHVVHSARQSWDSDPGGIEAFTLSAKELENYYDAVRGYVELKHIQGLEQQVSRPVEAKADECKGRILRAFGIYIEEPTEPKKGNFFPSEKPVRGPKGRRYPGSQFPHSV